MLIFALFNLKPGVSVEAYEAWAKKSDLPTVNALASIESFRVFRTTGVLGSDAPPPFGYIEVLDVKDMDQFGADVSAAAMQEVAAVFQGMVEVTFLTTEELTA
ncbi:REDY-like protein HapK [Novosphingobium barchaimii LL02]|uniref:REDY-like protein HapK n=1 Tax=Novosphingobium barchaimii LL02 TaxID=1114963 RepID=A0A0J7XY71_9SPHN|nr:REDY-like protein HapK [Novosphingobium barchaimii]KMS56489.1 REDY-like protein HapK [Novosphingobium barchaimii LL02]